MASSSINVKSGNETALNFIVKYLKYYENSKEIPAPEHPLSTDLSLKDIFEYEENIFGELLNTDDKINKSIFVKNLINQAEELQLEILHDKLSAIMWFYTI